jgi:hypothetical protein
MSPALVLTLCGIFLSGTAFVLFGAPFLPFLRPYAFPLLVVLVTIGNAFVLLVIVITVYIGWWSKDGVAKDKCKKKGGCITEGDLLDEGNQSVEKGLEKSE